MFSKLREKALGVGLGLGVGIAYIAATITVDVAYIAPRDIQEDLEVREQYLGLEKALDRARALQEAWCGSDKLIDRVFFHYSCKEIDDFLNEKILILLVKDQLSHTKPQYASLNLKGNN